MTPRHVFAEMVEEATLVQLAGERAFERGERYWRAGRVSPLEQRGAEVTATVIGTAHYRVVLRLAERSGTVTVAHSCSCPMGAEEAFCKHCVAVGLAVLAPSRPRGDAADVREFVDSLDRRALADLLLEEVARDQRLLERVRLRAAAEGSDPAALRRAIDDAVDPGDFVPYAEAGGWAEGVAEAIEQVERVAEGAEPAPAVELAEHALAALEDACGAVDDSDGHVTWLVERLERAHLCACERAHPDPVALAERILAWQLRGELEVFWEGLDRYSEVLGEAGLVRYEELARAAWERVPALGPGDHKDYGAGTAITHVMERIARRSGDPERLIAVLRRDLSMPYGFLRVAEAYRDAGWEEDAVEWAERGLAEFPDFPDHRLTDFLADVHAHAGRYESAAELTWSHFAARPSLDVYEALLGYAERAGRRDEWRLRAHEHLRAGAEEWRRRGAALGVGRHPRGDHSELVRVLLWEGELDAAWREAQDGGCSEGLWLELAERRAGSHPADALEVFRRLVGPTIERKTKRDYRDAVGLIGRVGELLEQLDRAGELPDYVDGIRAEHRRKRSLLALLNDLPGSG